MNDFATLVAGLDTDRLIVEQVMGGFCADPDKRLYGDDPGTWFWDHKRAKVDGKFTILKGRSYSFFDGDDKPMWDHSWTAWSPSTKIGDAFDVIGHLRTKYSLLVIAGNALIRPNTFQCGIFFTHPGDSRDSLTEYADSEPLAICRAALAAAKVIKERPHAAT